MLGHKEYSMVACPSSSPTLAPCLSCGSLCCGFLLPSPYRIAPFTHNAPLPNPSGCLHTANLTNHLLVPQAVSTPPTPAHSWGLTSRAEVSVPSLHLNVSVFDDCASSSDDLFGPHSAFQISDLLLCSSQCLEIPPTQLIFLLIR